MPNAVTKDSDGVVRVSVFSEGNAVHALFPLISAYVFKGVNRIGKATLVFEAGDMTKGEVAQSDDDSFAPGKNIRIEAGYDDDENIIFEGVVTTHTFSVDQNNQSTLKVDCHDYAFPATLTRKNKVFEKKKDSQAIQELLGSYSPLSASVDSTTTKYNELVQYYCTDWDFILSRADANGLVAITEGKTIKVKKPELSAAPKLKATYGIDIIEFEGELSAEEQQAEVEAVAWDAGSQEVIKVQAKKPSLNTQGTDKPETLAESLGSNKYTLQTEQCAEESAMQAWADAQRLKAGLSRILGYCKFPGNSKALHGDLIELSGLGKRFDGNAYIGCVEHDIKDGDWVTTVGLGLPLENITDKTDVVSPPASGFLPGVQGLHIGKVTKLNEDPTGEHKVQVEIPILNGDKNTIWARLAKFWGSNGYGSFFIPEVDDEVVIGFFNNDPCHAVVLGSMYSSAQPPPYELTSDNYIQAIVTKSAMKLEFNEEDKVITIETPGGNTIKISDKDKGIELTDQNDNKIVMNDSGVLIESAKELTIKAAKDIKIEAGMNLQAKAKTNVKIEGMNVEGKAKTALTMKGTASAEFSASGNTTVKGAMVMIN